MHSAMVDRPTALFLRRPVPFCRSEHHTQPSFLAQSAKTMTHKTKVVKLDIRVQLPSGGDAVLPSLA